jgi:hypothetical protein
MDLGPGNTQVFNAGEVTIGSIEVENPGSEEAQVQIVVSIRVVSTS